MADLHILRQHTLGLPEARKMAFQWAQAAEKEFGMRCTYEEGQAGDQVGFTRSGVAGTLAVTHDTFELNAKLGFLLSAFKAKIESEIVKNLDTLLKAQAQAQAPAKARAVRKK